MSEQRLFSAQRSSHAIIVKLKKDIHAWEYLKIDTPELGERLSTASHDFDEAVYRECKDDED